MKLKFLIVVCLAFVLPVFAADSPAPIDEHWTFQINGGGTTSFNADHRSLFGVELGLGRATNLILPFEAGVRQSISYASATTLLSTKAYADWTLLKVDRLEAFAGGNVGATYGNTSLTWAAGPEGGLRYWIRPDVAIEARAEWPFSFHGSQRDNLNYFVGLKINL